MAEQRNKIARVATGVAGLDRILGGGVLMSGVYIAMGFPGAGKTTLGNQIAFHHVANGGRALYVTLLAESHARMLQHLETLSFYDPKRVGRELSYVSAFNLIESDGLKGILALLREQVRENKISLVVIDGLANPMVRPGAKIVPQMGQIKAEGN